jgi:hypothetical protein
MGKQSKERTTIKFYEELGGCGGGVFRKRMAFNTPSNVEIISELWT